MVSFSTFLFVFRLSFVLSFLSDIVILQRGECHIQCTLLDLYGSIEANDVYIRWITLE